MYKLETGYFDIEIILSINNVKFMKKLYSAQQCIAQSQPYYWKSKQDTNEFNMTPSADLVLVVTFL